MFAARWRYRPESAPGPALPLERHADLLRALGNHARAEARPAADEPVPVSVSVSVSVSESKGLPAGRLREIISALMTAADA